jgi:hypothetical protein
MSTNRTPRELGRTASSPEGQKMFVPPRFILRFPIADLERWASDYIAQNDAQKEQGAQEAADRAKQRGSMTKDEFLTLVEWKSPRPKRWAESNTAADVEAATRSAFCTTNARVRIGVLMTLRGVSYPMASAILHLVCKDVPLLDVWALAALDVEKPSSYSFEFWNAYCTAVLSIAEKCLLPLRTIDRALWSYGKRHPKTSGGAER